MCTMAAMTYEGRTFLFKNFDYRSTPTGWVNFHGFEDDLEHFALVDHAQQGLNSGLNCEGLALQISRSRAEDPTPERVELRTILNAEVLATCSTVAQALAHIETYVGAHPEMLGGNVLLGGRDGICVIEYSGGRCQSQTEKEGFLARANHSVFGLIDNARGGSQERYEAMAAFTEETFSGLGDLETEAVMGRCRDRLREPPILQDATRSSFVMDVGAKRVDWLVGSGQWQTFEFSETVK